MSTSRRSQKTEKYQDPLAVIADEYIQDYYFNVKQFKGKYVYMKDIKKLFNTDQMHKNLRRPDSDFIKLL